nr:tumor necrosis factor receptor superfamily member 16-like [Oncorhynchus nerka]
MTSYENDLFLSYIIAFSPFSSLPSLSLDPLLPSYTSPTFPLDPSSPSFTDIFPPDSSSSPSPGGESTTAQPSPHFIRPGFNENLIPIYCSILAAVVVGLVAYIIFKRWNSCKQNKQPANNHQATAANQTVTPEGEKLHSDSGISVDSQSLQEQQHAAQVQTQTHRQEQIVVRVDGGPDSPPPQV